MSVLYKSIYNITVKPGNGGNGSKSSVYSKCSFFADGGNGGNGGDIVFQSTNNIFPCIRDSYMYVAQDGKCGSRSNRDGKCGDNLYIYLGQNCYLKYMDKNTNLQIFDYVINQKNTLMILKGGIGGTGSSIDNSMRSILGQICQRYHVVVKNFLCGICVIINYDYLRSINILQDMFGTTKFGSFLYVRYINGIKLLYYFVYQQNYYV